MLSLLCQKLVYFILNLLIMTTQIRLFEKFEVNIERGQLKSCEICGSKFSVFLAEHQCKRCLRAVCSGCGSAKKDVYKPQMGKKPHRLCKICNIESTILTQYISANKLTFGQDSQIGRKWRKKIPKPVQGQGSTKHQRKFTVQIFNQLWDAYNFSLRQFIGLHTYLTGQGDVYKLINTVYQQLQSRGVQEKLQNIILMIIFMLCYTNTDTCAHLVEYLCNIKKSVADQKQMLFVYLRALGIEESESKKLNDYINYKCKQFLGPISINAVTAECTIHVISKAFERQRIDETYMLLAIILQENWDMLLKNRQNKKQCDYMIVRNCNMSNYIQKYKTLVSVKVAQFSSMRASLKNIPIPQELGKSQLPQSPQKQKIDQQSRRSPSPKLMLKKTETFEEKNFQNIQQANTQQAENDLRAKALRNIARIKQQNEKKRKQDQEDSIDLGQIQVYKDFKKQVVLKKATSNLIEDTRLNQRDTDIKVKPAKQQFVESPSIKNQFERPVQTQPIMPIVHYQRQQCTQCQKKLEKLQDISEELKSKAQELQNTNRLLTSSQNENQRLKLEIKQLQEQLSFKRSEKTKQNPDQLEKIKQEIGQVTQKYNTIMKQLLKYQRENKTLKNEIEELTLNNKILKSKLEQNMMGLGLSTKVSQNEEELTRMNELMKKSIETKNKELQNLSKKNKELLTQIDQLSKSRITVNNKQSQKTNQLEKQKNDLMLKIKDLGDKIVKQQEEKLNLSSELFELKRSYSQMPLPHQKVSSQDQKSEGAKNRPSECFIF